MGFGPPSRPSDERDDRSESDRSAPAVAPARVDRLLSAADVAGFRATPDGTIVEATAAFASLIGYDRAELRGRPLESILDEDELPLGSLIDDPAEPASRRLSIRTATDTVVPAEVHLEPFRPDGDEPWIAGTVDPDPSSPNAATAPSQTSDADLSYGKTFRALADALPDGIIVLDTDSDIRYANPAVERILGHAPEELVGSSKVTIIPPRLRRTHLEALQRYLETGERNLNWPYVELPGQHADGHEVPLGVSINDFVYEGERYFVGLFRDITPRREAERSLKEKVAQLESVAYLGERALDPSDVDSLLEEAAELVDAGLDTDCCAVFELGGDADRIDPERFSLRASAGRTDLLERSNANANTNEGTTARAGVSAGASGTEPEPEPEPAPGPAMALAREALEATEPVVLDASGPEPPGTAAEVTSTVAVPIGSAADPWGVLEIYDAETDPDEFADHDLDFLESVASLLATGIERREYERRLNETVDELEASNERLEQFAYAVSHDLEEPLRMISSYLQLVERRYGDELDADGREFIEFAVDGADRMKEMIDGLLAYSRIDTRGEPFEPVDLEAVLEDVTTDIGVLIADSDAELAVEPLPVVEGDASQLRQLFQNLVSNAIKYSGDEPPRIDVTATRDGNRWAITVRDEGIGIEPDARDRIFRVFQRGDRGHDVEDGTGIGLAISRRIVDRHGGEISVESEPGEWTAVTVTLPGVESGPDSIP
ncbi:histidine kinase [Halobiforma lacisalsi AJ5]|uniref:histidine kinase n=1 Tax=Natronobacterium lacisalsi AJ5 TaxID=358396 RepID=M0LGW7_NATLA|nr:PAS domain S-box protein [Halobiforma lacisalsi]APW99538.1 histidine kinase [Halobiforma lacisalsi AJ5]EMA31664.1 multi-sensor signal transduction histidine kinase [Halobiforma lacisalsi AJ5]